MEVIYSVGDRLAERGVRNTAYHAAKAISEKGFLGKLLCPRAETEKINPSKIEEIKLAHYLEIGMQGVRLYIYHYPVEWVYHYVNRFYDKLASNKVEECDIFHGWNNHSLKSLRKAKKLGAKVVIERASSHPKTQKKILIKEYENYGKVPPYFLDLERSCKELKECEYILVPSEFSKESFLEQGFKEDKLILIPFGVDLDKFGSSKKKNSDKFVVIFVGAVTLQKGIQYLLEAWSYLNLENSKLLICGSVHEEVKDIVKKYRSDKTIKFLGHVKEVPYRKADVFTLPSLQEGSASVSYEAMASKLPVIVSENTGSVARNSKDGFVIPIRNSETLADRIRYFYDNPSEIDKKGKNARKRVEDFPWSRYENRLIGTYEEIAG